LSLTKRERLRRAFWHEPVDHLPTQINYTDAIGKELARHFGVAITDLPTRLGNHLCRVDLPHKSEQGANAKVSYDWWGAGWDPDQEGYWLADAPLGESTDLAAYPWPDPDAPGLLDDAASAIARDRASADPHFIVPNFGFCLFERAWSLRGFDTLMLDLGLDQPFVEDLLERIIDIQVRLARRFVAIGVDGGYFGDDYGAQKGLLFSPETWRQLFKPRLARVFAVFREAGLPVLMHSDGDIAKIVPDLVEIGLTALNPVQPEVLDHAWLKRAFGRSLAYYGGVSTQTVLPYGTPEEVRAALRSAVTALAPESTGLLAAPSHRLTSDVPMANVEALLAGFAELASHDLDKPNDAEVASDDRS